MTEMDTMVLKMVEMTVMMRIPASIQRHQRSGMMVLIRTI